MIALLIFFGIWAAIPFGLWVGIYVAIVVAVSLASIAVVRMKFGLVAAYFTALAVTGTGFCCLFTAMGSIAQDVTEELGMYLLSLGFGSVGAFVPLGIACLLPAVVNLLDTGLRTEMPESR